jgi:formamidopyrimidine-DNA glycosylase|tara:strand:- start:27 stop:848 length:822 start_codon:yes stop_codon:yes gene_type:complete
MPELPEVEVTRQSLEQYLQGQCIKSINIREKRLRWDLDQTTLNRLLDQRIHDLSRRGKYILINTAPGSALLHLGMSGSIGILENDQPLKKHDHFDLIMSSNQIIRFNDPRRFGSFIWAGKNPEEHKLLKKLGPEPLENNNLGNHLYSLSKGRKTSVKAFIMNAQIVVGVGNIYASEALFISGIHPKRKANRISKKRYKRLAAAIQEILIKSIKMGGTTLRDFSYSQGEEKIGYFKQELFTYGRTGAECKVCMSPIRQIVLSGRSSFYCVSCQY